MKFNLKSMSRKELEKLKTNIDAELLKVGEKELKAARLAAEKAVAALGFSLEDITNSAPKKRGPKPRKMSGPKKPAPPKYRNPNDATQTWTGKGRKPNWYKAAVSSGKEPTSLEI